jgi:L-lactate dehydrogenase
MTAETLVEGDLMGHDTHGLALLERYAEEASRGTMRGSGSPAVVADHGPSVVWDADYLPGPWLVRTGLDLLAPRARDYGSATLAIRNSHHIACLATYLYRATKAGFMLVMASSDPAVRSVAPFGGTRAVFTPNPIAAGIPTSTDPMLVDISASVTTNGMSTRLYEARRQFEHEWLMDAAGEPTRDPAVLFATPPGTIQPLGGLDAGHKGFGLALIVEALTAGLSGHGRADGPDRWGATVFMALYDPESFGGRAAFLRQMDHLMQACRENPPRRGVDQVRVPGEMALRRWREQMRAGVALRDTIVSALGRVAQRHAIALPEPLAAPSAGGAAP